MSVLSLSSDKELIEVSLQRKLVIALSPRVTSLLAVALEGAAPLPKFALLVQVVV